MSYTFDAVMAEVAYRRERLQAEAGQYQLHRLLRRRAAGAASNDRWELVRDGTDSRAYDLAA